MSSSLAPFSTEELKAEVARRSKCAHKLHWDNMYHDIECEGRRDHEGSHHVNIRFIFIQWSQPDEA